MPAQARDIGLHSHSHEEFRPCDRCHSRCRRDLAGDVLLLFLSGGAAMLVLLVYLGIALPAL